MSQLLHGCPCRRLWPFLPSPQAVRMIEPKKLVRQGTCCGLLPPRTAGCMMLACLSCSSVASELLTAAGRIIKLNTFCPCELVSLFHCSVRFILAAWGFGLERRAWGYDRLSNARWHQLACIALPAGKEHLYDLEAEMGIAGQILYCLYEVVEPVLPSKLYCPAKALAFAGKPTHSGCTR